MGKTFFGNVTGNYLHGMRDGVGIPRPGLPWRHVLTSSANAVVAKER